ncbi:hypothetical protein BDQ12DRAFT_673931 [Crucibulum laeve]|uniref:Uncharacterized protein n=1 Tax=Crucibulum laeve TaxID=68775 RepID=A0A5C3MUC7_9AGAR|nr:hypothetical protein BDQ12DRAFT_673931 [Crucibulum laeve]
MIIPVASELCPNVICGHCIDAGSLNHPQILIGKSPAELCETVVSNKQHSLGKYHLVFGIA